MPRLPPKQRSSIISLKKAGLSNVKIARRVHCSDRHVGRVLEKYRKHGTTEDLPKPGRPKRLGRRELLVLRLSLCRREFDNAVQAKRNLFPGVSVHTVQRALRDIHAKAYVKIAKPQLTCDHMQRRLEFALAHRDWSVEDWSLVWFSDECSVRRVESRGRQWVWDFPERGFTERRMKGSAIVGGGSVKIWVVISNQGFVVWKTLEGALDGSAYKKLLRTGLMPAIKKFWPQGGDGKLWFMQDNASVHAAENADTYLDNMAHHHNFNLVSWPSRSPDLNPLENLWALFKRHLLRFPVPPNLRQTRELVERELPNFEREHIKLFPKLYESLPKRMNMVVKSKGLPTKY